MGGLGGGLGGLDGRRNGGLGGLLGGMGGNGGATEDFDNNYEETKILCRKGLKKKKRHKKRR
jgi:hypothetical protein